MSAVRTSPAAGPPLRSRARQWRVAVTEPACSALHRAVTTCHPALLPEQLRLKHTYDYRVYRVSPSMITRKAKAQWNVPDTSLRTLVRRGGAFKSVSSDLSRNVQGRFVLDGDWDRRAYPFRPVDSVQLLLEGASCRDLPAYDRMIQRVRAGDFRFTKGCRTEEEVERHFAELVNVITAVREHGYLSQEELGKPPSDEIRIAVDRDGGLCVLSGGTHRLSIAQLLGLDVVPVVVKQVHARWIEAELGPGALRGDRFHRLEELLSARLSLR